MALIVQKYGGTSVGTPEKIIEAARQVRAAWADGHEVVVVVSAMGGVTNKLLHLASAVSDRPDPGELDALLCTGEAASSALLSIALNDQGVASRSFSGAEAGIRTDHRHGRATIEQVDPRRLHEDLRKGMVPVVAGFQGEAGAGGPRTTLGRGGSDTTGVALAAALGADYCEIVTDVAGVYTADPRKVAGTRRHDALLYEEMAELAVSGAKVLAADSVDYARTHGVDLKVRSNQSVTGPETWVVHRRNVPAPVLGVSWMPTKDTPAIAGVASHHGLAGVDIAHEVVVLDLQRPHLTAEPLEVDVGCELRAEQLQRVALAVALDLVHVPEAAEPEHPDEAETSDLRKRHRSRHVERLEVRGGACRPAVGRAVAVERTSSMCARAA